MYNKTMLSQEIIQNLKNDHAFGVFKRYILEKMNELDSIHGFDKLSTQEAGELIRVNSAAYNVLVEILKPVISFKKKQAPTEKQMQEKKDSVGLS